MKTIEKLIELLPVPVLVGAAAVCLVAWITKESRGLGSWGLVFRDINVHLAALLAALGVTGYYGTSFILRAKIQGTPKHGLYVAQFDGDSKGLVQKHTIETVQTALSQHDDLKSIRVHALNRPFSGSWKPDPDLTQNCLIYGTFIEPKVVHYKLRSGSEGAEQRFMIPAYPDIDTLTNKVIALLMSAPRKTPRDALEDELAALRAQNRQFSFELRQNNRLLRSLQFQATDDESVKQAQSKAIEYYSRQKKHVLAIGINSYERLPTLQFAVADAELFSKTVGHLQHDGVEAHLLLDQRASRQRILSKLDELADSTTESDQVVLYYAGHGITSDGVGYIVPADADPQKLEGTAISMHEVGERFKRIPTKQKIMFVDSCYAGAFDIFQTRHVRAIESLEKLVTGSGDVVIAAGTDTQAVVDYAGLKHGVFTYYLAEGLLGRADTDGDQLVTVTELFSYVRSNLMRLSGIVGLQQTATMHARAFSDFAVSVAAEGEIPAELQAHFELRPEQVVEGHVTPASIGLLRSR